MQYSVKSPLSFTGVGLHSGRKVTMRLRPGAVGAGVVFHRTDVNEVIPALWDHVVDTQLCTVIANMGGTRVSTIEHIMAALAGCGIDNVIVELDGPEVPVMDGSSRLFVEGLEDAGKTAQEVPLRAIEILRPVEVRDADKVACIEPSSRFELEFHIDFEEAAIGQQSCELVCINEAFLDELSDSRTFTRFAVVEHLRSIGLALGGSLDNAVVVDGDRILNKSGLRRPDEFVRHKMLDAVGDLALAGAPLIGRYVGHRAGHAMNNELLRAVFADDANWRSVSIENRAGLLPCAALASGDEMQRVVA